MPHEIKIDELRVLRGPNIWSSYRKNLIQLKIDLREFENFASQKTEEFLERMKAVLHSLYAHNCAECQPANFNHRLRTGAWLGHVVGHIALELQSLAGMRCVYGRTRSSADAGKYLLVFEYKIESVGVLAAKEAVRIAQSLLSGEECETESTIAELDRLKRRDGLGPSTSAIVEEARKRDIPFRRLDEHSLVQLGQGKNLKLIKAALTCSTSVIGVDIADNKEQTKQVLRSAFVPVPEGRVVSTIDDLLPAIDSIGFPLAIKPRKGNHGRGVRTNIQSEDEAIKAFHIAKSVCEDVIVERFIHGSDYRFLVINKKLVAAAKRIPAVVTGDGISTITQLVEKENMNPRRGEGHENVLTNIKLDEAAMELLAAKGLTPDSVVAKNTMVQLQQTANLSTGGTSRDVSHLVHPKNVFMAERIARMMNLDICGIDLIAEDISQPITSNNGAVLEVNACPGLRMHLSPSGGLARNVAESIVNMLYPAGTPSRIPLVAVTGTNGKTTVTRLITHMAKTAGFTPGFTSTDGIFIDGMQVEYGDCSGPSSAAVVLRDPIVDFAVLECARGGILRSGLGFDHCDTSIITNITEDHLGLAGVNNLNELARVKAVVARSTFDHGYAILNADDDLVYAIREELDCNLALFSMNEDNERIRRHCAKDGLAAVIERGYFTIRKGNFGQRIARVSSVPLTLGGRVSCMIQNIMPAILSAVIHGFSIEHIRKALETFIPGPEMTPGRFNIFNFDEFSVMVDYAHNPDGFLQLGRFMQETTAEYKVGIIAVPGDRRDEDILAMGAHAARMFHEIIIRHDKDLRGRTQEEITELLTRGIHSVDNQMPIAGISDEQTALRHCMCCAKPGSFIVLLSDELKNTLGYLAKLAGDREYFEAEIVT